MGTQGAAPTAHTISITRNGEAYAGRYSFADGWVTVSSPLGSKSARAPLGGQDDFARLLLGEIVDKARRARVAA